jgi:hypothetical protein
MLPVLLRRCGLDPTGASAPFVATLVGYARSPIPRPPAGRAALRMGPFKADSEAVEQAFESVLETAFFNCFAVRRGCIRYDPIKVWESPAFNDGAGGFGVFDHPVDAAHS